MKKINIKRAIAISGVIGGIVLLKTTPAYAVENTEEDNYPRSENVNARISLKGQVVNVDSTYLRIRSSASTSAEVLGTMTDGTKFDIISKEGQWYKIQYNNVTGYAHGDYVQEINTTSSESVLYYGKVYNAAPNLRVRSGSSLNASVIGYVVDNTTVTIVGSENGWYKIQYNGGYGFVHGDYISVDGNTGGSDNNENTGGSAGGSDSIMAQGTVINVEGSNLRVRKGPSTDVAVLGYLLNNTTVDITGKEGNWYKIDFKGAVGYVSSDYISLNGQASSGSGTTTESTSNQKYNEVLTIMKAQLGAPYVWAGSGELLTTDSLNELKRRYPQDAAAGEYDHAEQFVNQGYRAFDCSGLMQWSFAQVGVSIGRSTYSQINNGVEVSLNDVQPGDLIFTPDLGHVGMYIGNDQWIESPYAGKLVRVSNVPWESVSRARRVL